MNRIIAFSGSTRENSYNKKILKSAVFGAREAGAEVTLIDLRDYPMPIYDGDLEESEGIPYNCLELKKLFKEHHALLLALPEYNGSMSGVFKNTIDWLSRTAKGEGVLECFTDKVAALISASIGNYGGLRGLNHARAMLESINVIVMPEQVCVPRAETAFDELGSIKDDLLRRNIEKVGSNLVNLTLRVKGFHSRP